MKRFLALYMAPAAEFEKIMTTFTPEQMQEGMDEWMKWMKAHQTHLADNGAPLGKTKRVDAKGSTNTKNEIGGYSIVQADSHDAAAKVFGKDHPHLQIPGAWIEIIRFVSRGWRRY